LQTFALSSPPLDVAAHPRTVKATSQPARNRSLRVLECMASLLDVLAGSYPGGSDGAGSTDAIAEQWWRFYAPHPLPVLDGLLAATAKVHGLTLVTRNPRVALPLCRLILRAVLP
jgi:hypothetical protein